LLGVEARLAKTDAVLLLTVVTALGALGRVYLDERGARRDDGHPWTNPAIFWTAIAAGVLLKGPLILMFVGLTGATLMAFDRSAHWLRRLKPAVGIPWTLLLVLPWFAAIVIRSGDSFFIDSVGKDLLAKVTSGQESHGLPPGFYTVLFWVTFFPGSMLAALATPAVWRARAEPRAKIQVAGVVPAWIVFELVPTKLPHYVLPLYPAIAILIAGIVDTHALSRARWLERGTLWWFVLSIAAAVAVVVLHVAFGQGPGFAAWPFAAVAIIAGLFAWWLYEIDGAEISLLRAAAASILISFAIYGATFPMTRKLFPAIELGNYVRPSRACPTPAVATAGYHEPSLVFLTGTGLKHTDGSDAAEFLRGGPCRFALIEARNDRSFVTRADAIGLRYTKGARIEGINISGGRAISVVIYRSEAP
jgi:4-amino-4-deoxy-L-arabinose transferase-like glycosyltransferase